MNKPKFNPSKPFEAVGAKPKFNPNAAAEPVDEEEGLRPGGLSGSTLKGGAAALLDALGGSSETVAKNAANTMSMGNMEYSPKFKENLASLNKEFPRSATGGKVGGMVGVGSAAGSVAPIRVLGDYVPTFASKALGSSGGLNITPAMTAAIQGLMEKPAASESAGSDFKQRLEQAKNSAEVGGALQLAGSLAGKGGDYLMQKAVGRNRVTPGVGTELADEGLWGTRNMMRDQVRSGKEKAFERMKRAVSGDPALYDTSPVSAQIRNVGKNKIPAGGALPRMEDMPYLSAVEQAAQEVDNAGMETLPTLLSRRRAAGERAFSKVTDAARQGVQADTSKAEQIGISNLLKNAAPDIIPADRRYAALAKAAHGLSDEQLIRQSDGSMLRFPKTPAGLMGHIPTALLESSLGQLGTKASQNTNALNAAILENYFRQKRGAQ